jgi:hypothetical protein
MAWIYEVLFALTDRFADQTDDITAGASAATRAAG